MKSLSARALALATALVFASGCASTTMIRSQPPGAKVYLNGESVGRTPYPMTDTKIIGTTTYVRLVLDGHEPYETVIQRNEQFEAGPCLGGVLVMFPFLWIMGYKPEHNYELTPLRPAPAAGTTAALPVLAPPRVVD
jgi:hypothetical protein